MKKRHVILGLLGLLTIGAGATAYIVSPTVHPGQSGEAPELGRTGEYSVGTIEKEFVLADRTKITAWGALTGDLNIAERKLAVRIWYPAQEKTEASTTQYVHEMNLAGKEPFEIISNGIAVSDAAPLAGEKFPLVLMSHGYGGWSTQFSNLGEHLASRGYVVASIDHGDAMADGIASAILSFGNVLVDRTLDQRQMMDLLLAEADRENGGYAALIDTKNLGLIGYSMGGYGAIASAGAPYVYDSDLMSNIPETAQESLKTATAEPLPIKALVAFAPWGGQPDNRAWSSQTMSNINVPALIISGNQDDIVNYDQGVTWLFDNMKSSDRYLLTFREARHNIVGNDFEVPDDMIFSALEFLKEPVWRSDRLNAINQHFVTAFLDLHLKSDQGKAGFLNVPTIDSNEAAWPIGFGEQLNGKLAGPEETKYWRGFQRRWATGLELRHASAGE